VVRFQIAWVLAACLLAGCGQVAVFGHTIGEQRASSEVKRDPTPVSEAARLLPGSRVVSAVTLVLTEQATAKVAEDARFKTDALLDAVKADLRSRQLLDETNSSAQGTAEISIDDFEVHRTSNAVVLGYIMSDGTLSGEILVRDRAGNGLSSYRIEAGSRLTASAKAENPDLMAPLYRRFASLTGDWLAGTPSKTDEVSNQRYR
jgi:hypothetical protein